MVDNNIIPGDSRSAFEVNFHDAEAPGIFCWRDNDDRYGVPNSCPTLIAYYTANQPHYKCFPVMSTQL